MRSMECDASALMNRNERNLKTLTAFPPMMITFLAGAVNGVLIKFYPVLICVICSSFLTQSSLSTQALNGNFEITKCCNADDHTSAFIGVQANRPNMPAYLSRAHEFYGTIPATTRNFR